MSNADGDRLTTLRVLSADMDKGIIGSMKECGVTESYKLKRQVILSASEAAEMILRVDDSASFSSSVFAAD